MRLIRALPGLCLRCFACTDDGPKGEGDGSSETVGDGDGDPGDGDPGDGDPGDGDPGDGDGDPGDGDGDSGDGDGDPLPDPSCEGIGDAVDELGTVPGDASLP